MQDFRNLLRHVGALLDAGTITFQESTAIVGRHIQGQMACSRLTCWTLDGEAGQRVMTRVGGFDGVTNTPILEPASLTDAEFSDYFDALTHDGICISDDTMADDRLRAMRESYLVPRDIRASLDAAISVNGRALGVLCCAQQGATRHWLPQEVALLRRFASDISLQRARRRAREGRAMTPVQALATPHAQDAQVPSARKNDPQE